MSQCIFGAYFLSKFKFENKSSEQKRTCFLPAFFRILSPLKIKSDPNLALKPWYSGKRNECLVQSAVNMHDPLTIIPVFINLEKDVRHVYCLTPFQ